MSGKIAIVYFTKNGTTQQLARQIQLGANDSDASAELFEIVGSDIARADTPTMRLFRRFKTLMPLCLAVQPIWALQAGSSKRLWMQPAIHMLV